MENGLASGIALFNAGDFYESHEVLEDAWRQEAGARKLFLQALIHFAVSFYHAERGNAAGAMRQLNKGVAKLAPYLPEFEGVDTTRLLHEALNWRSSMEQARRVAVAPTIHRCSV